LLNANKEPVYYAGCVGIILDPIENTQKFFGGGEVESEKNNMKNDKLNHNDDIECIAMTKDRKTAVTGQRGPNPTLFTWNALEGGEKITQMSVPQGKSIKCVAISPDGKYVAAVDGSVDHKIHVFDDTGKLVFSENGDKNVIYGVSFSQKEGDYKICTTGKRHVCFWDFLTKTKKKGISGTHPIGIHMQSAQNADGATTYTAFQDGSVFEFWDNKAGKVHKVHNGAIDAIKWSQDMMPGYDCLATGGRDGTIKIHNVDMGSFSEILSFTGRVGIKSLDVFDLKVLVGYANGDLEMCNWSGGSLKKNDTIMSSHTEGEVWGLT
jgi:WD40 repeat protein